jgi:RNA polymerase sigma-70 factor (ECF subfamily)
MLPRLGRSRPTRPERDSIAGQNSQLRNEETSDTEDLKLIQHLQQGQHDALTELFAKYSGYVFGIARRMLREDGEAEEVVQQVFLDIYRAANQFDESKGSFKNWLFQFAFHRTINRRNHLEAKGFYSGKELHEQQLSFGGAGRALQLSSQETVHLIEQLLNSIKPKQRDAIKLTFFEGLTAEEIAEQTGETAAAVRHNLYRGLSKLRAILLQNEAVTGKSAIKNKVGEILFAPARPL